MFELKLPEIGENVEEAVVSRLLVSEGDAVQAEQSVMELDSEKASFPLPSPRAGRVGKILVKEGETVSVGQPVIQLEESQPEEKSQAKSPLSKETKPRDARETEPQAAAPPKTAPATAPAANGPQETKTMSAPVTHQEAVMTANEPPAPAGPATRRLARELGIDLHQVPVSAPGGRITREEVKAFVQQRLSAAPGAPETTHLPDFARWGPCKRQSLNAIARTTAERLSVAWRTIPHVTQHKTADITELEAARQQYNREREGQAKVTVTVLAMHAVVTALKAQPQFNSSLDPAARELIVKEYYHIGVAVDTGHGLLVPVIRDVDRKSIVELTAELAELADKARKRMLKPSEMEGGTFTITNLGGIGGTAFTPIVNFPEVAILGMSQARQQPVVRSGAIVSRLILPLSLSYDHRVINGADGARFVGKVAELLSAPFRLLAES